MNATRIFGIVAAVSGAALLGLVVVTGVAAAVGGVASLSISPSGASYPMGMGAQAMGGGMGAGSGMTGMGVGSATGMMGSDGMGAGMMGSGQMMGSGHMYGWGGTSTATSSAAIPGALEVRVTAGEFTLSPAEIVLPASGEVNLTLENRGALPHDLTIPGLGVRVVAAGGQTQTVGLRDLPAGTYTAYCSIPGHADAGMRATVIVR